MLIYYLGYCFIVFWGRWCNINPTYPDILFDHPVKNYFIIRFHNTFGRIGGHSNLVEFRKFYGYHN